MGIDMHISVDGLNGISQAWDSEYDGEKKEKDGVMALWVR